MNSYLKEKGVQFKQSSIWLLYQKYAQMGYTSTKTHSYNGNDGTIHTRPHTYWTTKRKIVYLQSLKGRWDFPNYREGGSLMTINKFNGEGYYDPTPYEALKKKYRPLVYIASPFSGDMERNTRKAQGLLQICS